MSLDTERTACPWCEASIAAPKTRWVVCGVCGKRVEIVRGQVGVDGPHREMVLIEALAAPGPPATSRLREEQEEGGADVVVIGPRHAREEVLGRAGAIWFFGALFTVFVVAWILGKLSLPGEVTQLGAILLAIALPGAISVAAYRRMLRTDRVRLDGERLSIHGREGWFACALADVRKVNPTGGQVVLTLRDERVVEIGAGLTDAEARWLGARIDRARRVARLVGREMRPQLPAAKL